jgi:hypothetical protein
VLNYQYDFGDDREHRVSVETVTVADPDPRDPRCTGGQGTCPPEDCGGIPGYRRLRDGLADPSAPEREELLEWLALASPAGFDPARFDIHDVDARLAAITWATRLR